MSGVGSTEPPRSEGAGLAGAGAGRVSIGRVGRPHGIDGSFFVEQPSDDARWWKTGATFLADGAPVAVVAHRTSSGRPVVKLDRSVERGAQLEVERDSLPPTEEDEYYAFQLIGLEVVEEPGRVLGTVKAVRPGVANDVLELDTGVLLPMVEDCVRRVDLDAGRIEVAVGFAE
jgi:16S rRNA processing protein RimM